MNKSIYLIITITLFFGVLNCDKGSTTDLEETKNYREEMRNFVIEISNYAESIKPDFIIIPQNGHELLTINSEDTGNIAVEYMSAIDGIGREDLFYGYDEDNVLTPTNAKNEMILFMDIAEGNNVEVLVTDYCSTPPFMDDSYSKSEERHYISFAANDRELKNIPSYPEKPNNVNDSNITKLSEAKNFLYIINPDGFTDKTSFFNTIKQTNYDLIIMDLYDINSDKLSSADIISLKTKANGGSRLVIAYMSIGEAENYRFYWNESWESNSPEWLAEENKNWEGNYKVRYWQEEWQEIIYDTQESYLKKILDAGFDGVYLDIIDAYEYFEDNAR